MAEPAPAATTAAKQSAITSRFLSDAEEIARVFRIFRDQRANLQLRFQDKPSVYAAKVLDLQKRSILLEDIQPRDGLAWLRSGKPFALSGRVDGVYIHSFQNRVHKTESERGLPFFHVALPDSLLYQQRRRSARFRLPLRVAANGARVMLFRQVGDADPAEGHVIDVSAGGCRAEFKEPLIPPAQNDELLAGCAISIPNLLELTAKGVIRHCYVDRVRQITTCGIEFTEMHVTDRRRLEQFVQVIAKLSQ
jgi:c-di-GMP-binding flagellar brake protein YcgR